MKLRKMTKADNPAIKKLVQDSLKTLGYDIPGTAYFDPQLDDLFNYYRTHSPGQYWVIEQEHQIIGGVGIAPFSEASGICELQKLYLAEKFQGLGLSKKLMVAALNFAKKHYRQCYLETHTDLATACRLYEKYGFQLLNGPLKGSEHSAMNAWYLLDLEN
ncbi:GNAT family N-acetyltransferase [Enterococcus massiliensis]|uniref:GNAT family N-acetyltransferase n=1 Tax=Enterococcus massiliensis TaxID=1640685 RepID=UPI00065DD5A3|nr:GNAT family N-acetyltransferase [Enterococcus massiliensis]